MRHRGSGGLYAVAEQTVWTERRNSARALTLFGQLGSGDPRVNEFGSYTGGGLTLTAPLPTRDQDEVGFGIAAAHNGSNFTRQQINQQLTSGSTVAGAEVALELTYLAQVASWLAVQPDIQYVINPGTDRTIRNAFTGALRFELAR